MEKTWQQLGFIGFVKVVLHHAKCSRASLKGAVGVDPRGDVRSILWLRAVGCTEVYSFDRFLGSTSRVPPGIASLVPECSTTKMRWQNNLAFLEPLRIANQPMRAPNLSHLSQNSALVNGRIGIVAVAPWPGKFWLTQGWVTVVEYLKARSLVPVLICGPGQESQSAEATGFSVKEILSAKDVFDLARIISSCEALITLDSGPMHLASALKKPLVALFGPAHLPLWAPFSPNCEIVVSPLTSNGPIHLVDSNIELGKKIMREIESKSVIVAFEKVSAGSAKKFAFGSSLNLPAFLQK
ncbi:glycosyltransferase family 9 protein [Candidatus Korobacter versatilis]|nr:glycosyltransferase family 9 protein [Candidatus Koribacter versatilis]